MEHLAAGAASLLLAHRQSKLRWLSALAIIRSARAFFLIAGNRIARALPDRARSYTSIDIDGVDLSNPDDDLSRCSGYGCGELLGDTSGLFRTDPKLLASLAKNRDHHALEAAFRNAEALAGFLLSHPDCGAHDHEGGEISAGRIKLFGSNAVPHPTPRSFLPILREAIKELTLIVLLLCAAVSLVFGIKERGIKEGWYRPTSIFIAVVLVVAVSTISKYRLESRFDKLSDESADFRVDVVRDGRRQSVPASTILVGDVVWLKIGDQVPADGVLLDGHALRVDNYNVTGERPYMTVYRDGNPFLLSGAKVVDGYGRVLVTAVGGNTTWGQMMAARKRESRDPTPLQKRVQKITWKIGITTTLIELVAILAASIARYLATGVRMFMNGASGTPVGSKPTSGSVISALVKLLSDSVTVLLMSIPEGLPLALALVLAYSMKRMMADKAMVRKLSAFESLAAVTTICTSKAGVLTRNQMKVDCFFVGTQEVQVPGSQDPPFSASAINADVLKLMHCAIGMNTSASVYTSRRDVDVEIAGSPTEKAILSWAVKELGMDMDFLKQSTALLQVEAFNSEKKRSGVLIRNRHLQLHWKGAAEMILASCSRCQQLDGLTKPLGANDKAELERTIERMAMKGLRCIAFAYKDVRLKSLAYEQENNANADTKRLKDNELTLLGIVGLKDPCHPEVRKSVEACRKAGVSVRMVTGDNIFTARAVAVECGILTAEEAAEDQENSGFVIEGHMFRDLSEEERMKAIDTIKVMARSSPEDKWLIVECLKRKGEVVAVTGHGAGDAPAIKEADVGLAMGIQGTEMAKECSDVVVLDDVFQSVVTAIRWGRCVYTNIQKFLLFQLTVNASALCIDFVANLASRKIPQTTLQMLWVNLIMDTLGVVALAMEPPTDELLQKLPVGSSAPLMTAVMWRNLLAQVAFQVTAVLTLNFRGGSLQGIPLKVKNADTVAFNTFVLCQIFNMFNARRLEEKNVFVGVLRNRLFMAMVGVTIVLQSLMVELLTKFADTQRLDLAQWAVCLAVASFSWPIGWLVKCIPIN